MRKLWRIVNRFSKSFYFLGCLNFSSMFQVRKIYGIYHIMWCDFVWFPTSQYFSWLWLSFIDLKLYFTSPPLHHMGGGGNISLGGENNIFMMSYLLICYFSWNFFQFYLWKTNIWSKNHLNCSKKTKIRVKKFWRAPRPNLH